MLILTRFRVSCWALGLWFGVWGSGFRGTQKIGTWVKDAWCWLYPDLRYCKNDVPTFWFEDDRPNIGMAVFVVGLCRILTKHLRNGRLCCS